MTAQILPPTRTNPVRAPVRAEKAPERTKRPKAKSVRATLHEPHNSVRASFVQNDPTVALLREGTLDASSLPAAPTVSVAARQRAPDAQEDQASAGAPYPATPIPPTPGRRMWCRSIPLVNRTPCTGRAKPPGFSKIGRSFRRRGSEFRPLPSHPAFPVQGGGERVRCIGCGDRPSCGYDIR